VLDLTLDQVRAYVGPGFRGLMNPTEMRAALDQAGVVVNELDRDTLYRPMGPRKFGSPVIARGITRLQWDGPWLRPGVPPSVAYRHTHWVASVPDRHGFPDAFDCNWGWQGFGELFGNMRSLALETPGATGAWWPTHIYEIALPAAAVQTG
jgi:hypothetical protein